jgi:hypothetical protein
MSKGRPTKHRKSKGKSHKRSHGKSHKRGKSHKKASRMHRRRSICSKYKKASCGTVDDRCSWRKKTGCVLAQGKSKSKLNKEFHTFFKNMSKEKYAQVHPSD